jgi:predicted metalloprotease with PDZ domain
VSLGYVTSEPTDNGGVFELAPVPAGKGQLLARAEGYETLSRELLIEAGQKLELGDVALEANRTLPGTIGATFDDAGPSVLVRVFPDGPAERAGVRDGDRLLSVDGQVVKTAEEARQKTIGSPGSSVKLNLRRDGAELVLNVVRA